MIQIKNSFLRSVFFLIFLTFQLQSCNSDSGTAIEEKNFIEIYAKIMIINELNFEKEKQDQLILELFQQYKIDQQDIESTIQYYNRDPEKWVDLLQNVRKYIQNMKEEDSKIKNKDLLKP